jgi:hypothetical protein
MEKPATRARRLERERASARVKREEETPEEADARRTAKAAHERATREEETQEEGDARRSVAAARGRIKREKETPEERAERLRKARPSVKPFTKECLARHPWVQCGAESAGHWVNYQVCRFGEFQFDLHRLFHPLLFIQKTGVLGHKQCSHCAADLFEGEKSNECCMYGAVKLEPLPPSPPLIQDLCDPANTCTAAKEYREHIVGYNTALSLGSLSAGIQLPPGRGPPVVLMNGQQSQQIGNLRPPRDAQGQRRDPLFGQVYVIDDLDAATDIRLRTSNLQLNRGTLRQLGQMVQELNPYARRLSSLGQQLERAERGEAAGVPPPQYFRLSILDNRPAPGQVFAVFDSRTGIPPNPDLTGIYIYSEGHQLQRIAIWNKNADWILFPLMFPAATQTYGPAIPRSISTAVVEEVLLPADDADLLAEIDRDTDLRVEVISSASLPPQPVLMLEPPPVAMVPVEPAVWDDDVATTDMDIPAAVVDEVIDVGSSDEEEGEDSGKHLAPH